MNTDENKERSATPNIHTIAQWDFIKLNPLTALIFDGEVEHWNQSGTPPKLEKLEEYWRRLIVDIDPQQREQNLANTLATLGKKIRDIEDAIEENKSQESLNREKSPHCEALQCQRFLDLALIRLQPCDVAQGDRPRAPIADRLVDLERF